MKFITKQDENDLLPNYIDIQLAEVKELAINGQLTDEYFQLQSVYYHLLELYISSKFDVDGLEQKLIIENIRQVEDNEKDIYQYLSNHNYFYIRNTLYVEKLPKEIINVLINTIPNELTSELSEMINLTYKEVITTSDFKMERFDTSYGPLSNSYSAANDDLVIGFRTAEEDESLYENEDEWFKDYMRRRAIITDLLHNLPKEISSKLNVNCKIIEYFEESVKKK